MIVDDHAVVRSGLSAFLLAFDDLEYVGEAGGGAEAVERCLECRPDVILMDLVMPDVDGAEATRRIKEACPRVQVIALTSYREDDLVQGALKAGVDPVVEHDAAHFLHRGGGRQDFPTFDRP